MLQKHSIATTTELRSLKLLRAKTPLLYMFFFMNWLTHEFWTRTGRLITPIAPAHLLHPINSRSRKKRRNLWVGRCVSSWWPWFPSINHLLPVCWFTFWKSTLKQQLGCRFDMMDCKSSYFCILTYAIVYVLIYHKFIFRLYLYFLNSVLYFYQVLLY